MKRSLVLACLVLAAAALIWMSRSGDRAPSVHSAGDAQSHSIDPAEHLVAPASGPRMEVAPDAVRYTGSVVDPEDHGIANATIRVFSPWRGEQEPVFLAETRSDERGAFEIAAAPGWPQEVLARASAEGFTDVERGLSATTSIALTLSWLTEVYGQVRDARTHAPISGATVMHGTDIAVADGGGRYRMPGVIVGEVSVHARAPGYAKGKAETLLRRRAPVELDIELEPCRALAVQVVDRESGAPVPGAAIVDGVDPGDRLGETDAAGHLDLYFAPGEELSVVVRAADYAPLFWSWKVEAQEHAPRLPLARYAFIAGRVAGEDGRPLAGVAIGTWDTRASLELPDRTSEVLTEAEKARLGAVGRFPRHPGLGSMALLKVKLGTRTDPDGRFELPVIPGPAPLAVSASLLGFSFEDRDDVVLATGGTRVWLDFTGRRTATIHGHARRNGKPYFSSTVAWQTGGEDRDTGRVGPDGAYALDTMATGVGTLVLRERTTKGVVARAELVVQLGASYEQDLAWTEEVTTITGKVLDASGAPAAGALLHARSSGGGLRGFSTAQVAADGSYAIRVLAHDEYDLDVTHETVVRQRPSIAAGASGIDFVVPVLGRIRLRLVEAERRTPVRARAETDWTIAWREAGADVFRRTYADLDADGVCTLAFPVGSVDLSLDLSSGGYAQRLLTGIEVRAGPEAEVTAEIESGVPLHLRARGEIPWTQEIARGHRVFLLRDEQSSSVSGPYAEGDPAANDRIGGMHLWLRDPSLRSQLVGFERDGNAELLALAPGRYTLRAFPDDLVFDPPAIDVAPSQTTVAVTWKQR